MDFHQRVSVPCVRLAIPQTLCVCYWFAIIAIGSATIRIRGVVVVDITCRIRIPYVVRIVDIR